MLALNPSLTWHINKNTRLKSVDIFEMDLTLEIETENQQHLPLKLIFDTIRISTSKEYFQLMSDTSKPKGNGKGTNVFLFTVSMKKCPIELVIKFHKKSKKTHICIYIYIIQYMCKYQQKSYLMV